MGAYLITNTAGSGKSAVIKELEQRGFAAYDTDDLPDVTRLEDRATGRPVEWPEPPVNWDIYAWNWQAAGLKKLLASGEDVFIGGIVSNKDDFYHLFDQIFVLTINVETLRQRLLTRTSNDFGKHPGDLARILSHHPERQRKLLTIPKAVAVDAAQPLEKVADDIIGYVT